MPRQNRVTPFGEIVANPARGSFMGNRGRLHDGQGHIFRQSERRAWITCLVHWPGIRREIMAPGQYTELFFLDEATALAAGHRPCGQCRHEALYRFKDTWAKATGESSLPPVGDIDAVLAAQRGHLHAVEDPEALPHGAMVTVDETRKAWLKSDRHWRLWSFEGYGEPCALPPGSVQLITPPAIVAALAAGYQLEG